MRALLAAALFAVGATPLMWAGADAFSQDKKQPPGKFDPPKATKPDDATLKQIAAKTEELRKAVEDLQARKGIPDELLCEVEVYLKAAENIVRFEEWFHTNSGKWTLTTLNQGLERAKQLADHKGGWFGDPRDEHLWQRTSGRWVVRAYRSEVDGSIQPYAVLLPSDYRKDPKKKWPVDVVLHGRDSSLTEAKFIANHDGSKAAGKDLDHVVLEVYGRGNNAYRWAGEADVFEALKAFSWRATGGQFPEELVDPNRVVLRGFSMGGAGTWHLGLHHPDKFCVIGPGAGFTTTHGYISGLKELPDHQEKCLHIYDAIDYAENAFNVPVVAYSGANDPQKKAADNIENALKGFKGPLRFTHLIAPGLEHQMPAEWQAKAEAEYRKYRDKGRDPNPERVRFVTYTPKYGQCDWVRVLALERTYEKAMVDGMRVDNAFLLGTTNVRAVRLEVAKEGPVTIRIDDQLVRVPREREGKDQWLEKKGGKWEVVADVFDWNERRTVKPEKQPALAGPIDDAFTSYFWVVPPVREGWHPTTENYPNAALDQFARTWDRYFRGPLPMGRDIPRKRDFAGPVLPNLVMFGDPASNPEIAGVLPKLPITWTKEKLVVNGVEYDAKTHIPVLIYPDKDTGKYVVINSGHTFKEADLKGTNALLYPRLGDWAVIRPTPTDKDPAAYEVVAAGLFDENWQFPKK